MKAEFDNVEMFERMERELVAAAQHQDAYDLSTINLIAPATPTPARYVDDIPLRHNAIAEGLLGKRPYAGAEGFNRIETVAAAAACLVFDADHANVQPHSVSQANQAVYQALLNSGDQVLAMKFDAGGHLTHGHAKNFSGQLYDFDFYGIDEHGVLDYDELDRKSHALNPKLIVCGASSYPRDYEYGQIREIAQDVGAYVLADLSHPAGLIAARRANMPFPDCDVVTLTPDKTLLGPHGGIILCKEELKDRIDAAVHPGVQSSVPLRRLFGTAQCLIDSQRPGFSEYVDRILSNMRSFEDVFKSYPGLMVTGGSSNHLMVLDTYNTFGLTGQAAEALLEEVGILTNRQVIPGEKNKPYIASGIRLGTAWISARGYSSAESRTIAQSILDIFREPDNSTLKDATHSSLQNILSTRHESDVWHNES